ncbi:MAG: TIGR04086 family membrane protein [Clostridia bacterium]|nr:TIGR04086 family membrane protein [Clostridia bacterium]
MAKNVYTVSETTPGLSVVMLKPLLLSLCMTLLAFCLLALFITFGPFSEKIAAVCVPIIIAISTFTAGLTASRRQKRRGLLTGAVAGSLYVLISYLIGVVLTGRLAVGQDFFKLLAMCVGIGAFGGILGINTRRKK